MICDIESFLHSISIIDLIHSEKILFSLENVFDDVDGGIMISAGNSLDHQIRPVYQKLNINIKYQYSPGPAQYCDQRGDKK